MPKKITKEVREVRFLYIGIVFLLIIALFLVLVLFSPLSPFKNIKNPPGQISSPEKINELLSAPPNTEPVQVPQESLNNLEGRKERVVPTREMMDMLSAPPPQQ